MDKIGMRDWVASLEEAIDKKLKKWRKMPKIENGETVQLGWTWEQTHILLNIFWEDKREKVVMKLMGPRAGHEFIWDWLDEKTLNKVMDRVGNLAQSVMYPPVDHDGNGSNE